MTKRLPEMTDILRIRYLGDPDCRGSRIAWTQSCWDTEAPEGRRRFIEQVLTGTLKGDSLEEVRQISAGGSSERCPRILADGSILFLSDAGRKAEIPETGSIPTRLENEFFEQRQLYRWQDGSIARLTSLLHGVERYLPSPDGKQILLLSWQYGRESEARMRSTLPEAQLRRELAERLAEPFTTESPRFKSDAEMGYCSDRKLRLWLRAEGSLTLLPVESFRAPCWLDNDTILFQRSGSGGRLAFYTFRPDSGREELLASLDDLSPCFEEHSPVILEDSILFAANEPDMEYAEPRGLYSIPISGGSGLTACRILSREADIDGILPQDMNFLSRSRNDPGFCAMPDDRVYFATGIDGDVCIASARAALRDQAPVRLTGSMENHHALLPLGEDRLLSICALPDRLPVLAATDIGTGRSAVLYDPNPDMAHIAFQIPQSIRTASGTQGFYLAPPKGSEKAPLITFCHGGPTGFYCSALNPEFQALAAAGFGVLYPNPRGGTGFGRERSADHFAYDGAALADIEEFTDTVCALHPELDPARAGVCGGSYGGFLTLYAAIHSRRFRAACAHRALADMKMISYASHSAGGSTVEQFPVFADLLKDLRSSSVSAQVDQIRIPLLLLYSELDANCICAQGSQIFTAMKALCPQVPCEFILYPDSCHGLHNRGPMELAVHHKNANKEWFERYL